MRSTRSHGGAPQEPFIPDEKWIDAFDAQFAGDLYERLKRFACSKAKALAYYGGVVDEYYIEELVADVVNDTLWGEIRWDPTRVDLRKHLLDSIQYRIRHACVHADKFRQVDLDRRSIAAEAEEVLADARVLDEERSQMAAALDATLDALRELAGDDVEVVKLLDGYRSGATEKLELLSTTGLTSHQYKAARERLHTLSKRLPDHLRTDAMRIR